MLYKRESRALIGGRPGGSRRWLSTGSHAVLQAAFALALCASSARADVVFSNFDAANSNRSSPALPISAGGGGWTVAQSFTPTQDYILGSVTLALSIPANETSGTFTVAVMADSGSGGPGTIVEQFTVTSAPISGTPVLPVILNSVLNPTLSANTTYWLVVAPGDTTVFGYWQTNVTGDVASTTGASQTLVSTTGITGPWDNTGWAGQPRGAFAIAGNPASGPSAPAISSLVPNTISAGSPGFTLTVNGTRFLTGATVLWNGTSLTTTLVSDSQLTAVVPAALVASTGVASVTVKNTNGQVSSAVNFTITALPQFSITGLNPSSAVAGGPAFTLTITGTNFTAGATVHFGSTVLTPSSVTPTQIAVTVPATLIAAAGTQAVTVTQLSATSNSLTFTITASKVTITSIAPNSVVAGISGVAIMITGTGFTSDATVVFGGTTLAPISVTATQILVSVPAALIASLGTPSVYVTQPSGGSNAVTFIIGESPGAPLAIATSTVMPVGKVGVAYSGALIGTGGAPPYSWVLVNSALPAGLTLAADGAITGTPTTSQYTLFTAKVTDSASATATANFLLFISAAVPAATITTGATLPPGTEGASYSLAFTATGGTPPYVWSVPASGLPAGLTLSAAGLISGTPTAQGSTTFTVQITDAAQVVSSKAFTLVINAPVVTQSSVFPHFTVGGGWKTSLYLVNAAVSDARIDLKFWSDGGTPLTLGLTTTLSGAVNTQSTAELTETIPHGATLLIESDGQGAAVSTSGWAQLNSIGAVEGYGVFHYDATTGAQSAATIPLESAFSSSFTLPYDGVNGMATGVGLANLAATQQNSITVLITNENGLSIANGTISLPANGHVSFLLSDRFPVTLANRGTVTFSSASSANFTGLGLRVYPTGGLTSLPKLQ